MGQSKKTEFLSVLFNLQKSWQGKIMVFTIQGRMNIFTLFNGRTKKLFIFDLHIANLNQENRLKLYRQQSQKKIALLFPSLL